MKQKTKLTFIISAAAVSLGLALTATAQTADVNAAAPARHPRQAGATGR